MKKYSLVSVVLIFMLSLSTELSAQGGDIQITCEPGLRIYLDGKFVGKSNANEDGKYLSNISSGRHIIRVEKTGFSPKEFIRDIRAGEVIEIKVGKLEPPGMTVTQRGESLAGDLHLNVGNLKIFSAPMRCEVRFRGQTFKKEKPEIEFGNVPTGSHSIQFTRKGISLSYRVMIEKGKTIEIKADFLKGKVVDITDEKRTMRLIQALKDKSPDVRASAARALAQIKSEKSVEPLILALKDENHWVRSNAAYALGEIKSEKAFEPLIQALKDKYYYVRSTVAAALGEIKSEKVVEPLIEAMKDRNESAAYALGEIKSEKAVKPLVQALKDEDSKVRKAASRALEKIEKKK
jgi:hypothetical protein